MSRQDISIITTCKGRLHHLQQTLPTFLQANVKQVVIVDFDCPDGTADWIRANHGTVDVVTISDRPMFNLAEARNRGAEAATGAFLMFIDADILLQSREIAELSNFRGDFFLRVQPVQAVDRSEKQTAGTCIVRRSDFEAIGGYDESFTLYGGEDGDLYHRLARRGVREEYFCTTRFSSIPHDDRLRTVYRHGEPVDRANKIGKYYRVLKHTLEDSGYPVPASLKQMIWARLGSLKNLDTFVMSVPLSAGRRIYLLARRKYILFGRTQHHVFIT